MSDNPNVAVLWELLAEYPAPNFTAERAALTAAIAALEAQASAPGGEVTEEMVAAALDAQPFKDANSGTRVWQLIASDGEGTETVMRAALIAALEAQASAPGEVGKAEEFALWLYAKYRRYGEEEELIRRLAALAARTGKGESDGR